MSDNDLEIIPNIYERFEEKNKEVVKDSESDNDSKDEKSENNDITVNKDSKFYKKLYSFIESKSKYINLILSCKSEMGAKIVYKKKYMKVQNKAFTEIKVENSLNILKEIVKNKFSKYSDEKIDLYLKEIINNPPKENCSLHKKFFKKNEKNIYIKHNIISYILNFMDCKTLMKFKECSKIDNEIVSLYLRKILYTLPFKDEEIKTNIQYWRNVVNYFFYKCGTLIPIDRSNYPIILNALEQNKSFCVITKNSMNSNIFISLDYLNEKLISSCNHNNPLPHTCDTKNEICGVKNLKTEEISMIDFIEEYYKRLRINDDELIWNLCSFRKSSDFLTLLLLEYLKCMSNVVKKYNGKCTFKKTEYFVNCGHHITHRIWIQVFYEYGYESIDFKKKKKNENIDEDNENRTLYLTIADHYKWDA
ncbi:conserved Plasmodium protein, unknown function [Plasmodium gallinaceum]|uniref:Uncharacterized protein n=1 Tax=Plasmodium gallinaceum TaxID=5849 RepID=A0A1J1GXZ4_PLAGA|nr:conserved Plasmodium protein, unknown function [Plasmodium gallinaceum]CRG97333.1 conserved Plasmodium protein, unknown function [Plasmodium gallinaceum]